MIERFAAGGMSGPPYMPEGLDPVTAEWAAGICDHVAARLIAQHDSRTAFLGAELAAHTIRAMLRARQTDRPLPRKLSLALVNDG